MSIEDRRDGREERVVNPTFGPGWLLFYSPSGNVNTFAFEDDAYRDSGGARGLRFEMAWRTLTTDSPRRHLEVQRAEARYEGAREARHIDVQNEGRCDHDEGFDDEGEACDALDMDMEGLDEQYFLGKVPNDGDGEKWFTIATTDGQVFGFRQTSPQLELIPR